MENTSPNLFFKKKSTGLRFISFLFTSVGFFFIYGEFTKAKFDAIDDLIFVKGPFKNYTIYNAGKTHSFSFQLKNYSNKFIINTDYLHLLEFDKFAKINNGQNIKVGFLKDFRENLDMAEKSIYVYAISGDNINYLDTRNTIKQYNKKTKLFFGLTLIACAIISYSYSLKLYRT